MKAIRAITLAILLMILSFGSPVRAGSTVDYFPFVNISSTPAQFILTGGAYGITLHAGTWGTATLQKLAPDNATWIAVATAFSADGYQNINLPEGVYRLNLSGISGLTGDITSIVTGP